jgi:hypothetical protein
MSNSFVSDSRRWSGAIRRRRHELAIDRGRLTRPPAIAAKTPRRGGFLPLQATSTSITPFSGPSNPDMLEPGSIEGRSLHRRKRIQKWFCMQARYRSRFRRPLPELFQRNASLVAGTARLKIDCFCAVSLYSRRGELEVDGTDCRSTLNENIF